MRSVPLLIMGVWVAAGCGKSIPGLEEGGIALGIERLATGSGDTLVSSGIPLPPGAVTPAQLKNVKITVGGKEQALYVEGLRGLHRDGSFRSMVMVPNFEVSWKSSPTEVSQA